MSHHECPMCGATLRYDEDYCPECGTDLYENEEDKFSY